MKRFDVAVVGGGHAGVEAAAAAARMGASVALVTFSADQIGTMSCNPAIGGLGKGHLVREVDAFDGVIAIAADESAIHYRMLNASKGAAVRGPRVQADRALFKAAVQRMVGAYDRITIVEGEAVSLEFDSAAHVSGVLLADGSSLKTRSVVLATGTFLGGKLHFGMSSRKGGRVDERAATALAAQLRDLHLPIARLKTGTPPRIDGRTIDWAVLDRQESDDQSWTMSSLAKGRFVPQIFCAITRTNLRTHEIIRSSLDRSPLFSGQISGVGPRYCPSIEDKVHRFGDRDGHQIFLEPESLSNHLVYPNGISTSLPDDVQLAMVRSMDGMSRAEIVQAGYAVEYDYVDPRSLGPDLKLRDIDGLYLAGQINGTTGYEEAAAQGLVAGLNAAAAALNKPPITFDRTQSYIGVMVDDLTLHGVTEPYRMLTARAEYRLHLRSDNADARLTPTAIEVGCVSDARRLAFEQSEERRSFTRTALAKEVTGVELRLAGADVKDDGVRRSLSDWLRFPAVNAETLMHLVPGAIEQAGNQLDEIIEDCRYAPYLERQASEIARLKADESVKLPAGIDYHSIPGLSAEMVEKLDTSRPSTLGAASRLRGVTPAALAAVLVHCRRYVA